MTIDGNGKTVKVSKPQSENTALFRVSGDGVVLSNMTFEFTSDGVVGYSADETPAEPAEPTIDADEQGFILLVTGKNVTLNKVTLKTNNATAGINVYQAENVTINDLFVDKCLKAPINISGSTNVVINGLTANGSSWYKGLNIVQVNGIGGIAQPSTVRIANASGIDAVWQEVVAQDYSSADPNSGTQSTIEFPDTVSLYVDDGKKSEGWMIIPSTELVIISEFTADSTDTAADGNYRVLTDGHYNGTYTANDKRDISNGALNMGGKQPQNGIGFYMGTQKSTIVGTTSQAYDYTVVDGDIYLMQLSYAGLTGELHIGGNVHAEDNSAASDGRGDFTVTGTAADDVSIMMIVSKTGATFIKDLDFTPANVKNVDGVTEGSAFRCGFTAWGNCLVDSIRVDKLNLDAEKLAGLMGN